jgi:hypothetical protein
MQYSPNGRAPYVTFPYSGPIQLKMDGDVIFVIAAEASVMAPDLVGSTITCNIAKLDGTQVDSNDVVSNRVTFGRAKFEISAGIINEVLKLHCVFIMNNAEVASLSNLLVIQSKFFLFLLLQVSKCKCK